MASYRIQTAALLGSLCLALPAMAFLGVMRHTEEEQQAVQPPAAQRGSAPVPAAPPILFREEPSPAGGAPLMEEPVAAPPPAGGGTLMEELETSPPTAPGGGTLMEELTAPPSNGEAGKTALTSGTTGALPAGASEIACEPGKVCRQTATGLPLRGLPRPFSSLYSAPDAASKVIASNLKEFWPLYIFARQEVDLSDPAQPKGWYQVGSMENDPMGWMQAKDVLEWKQALIVSYTHPGAGEERRNSVLMFDSKDALRQVVESPQRRDLASSLYSGLQAQPPQVPAQVVSREPARYVNIEEKFYMLPVLDFEVVDVFDDEARYLQLAAAVPDSRAQEGQADTLSNAAFASQAAAAETTAGTQAKELGFDIKFVMDMTNSMGPYLQGTKQAIADVAKQVSANNLNTRISYGLVGYRDDIKAVPGLAFTSQNFTPALVDAQAFDQAIAQAAPAKDASGDYTEEVYAGLVEAINSPWSDNSLKFIVLIGDASAHEPGHAQSTTGLGAAQVRELLDSNKTHVISVHLKAKKYAPDHAQAEQQFSMLATNSGSSTPAYMSADADSHQDFQDTVDSLAMYLSASVAQIRANNLQVLQNVPDAQAIQAAATPAERAEKIAQMVAANALIEYLGSAANPPRDLTAWVMDRDLIDPAMRALQVRVLLRKRELNDLIGALENVLKAVKRSQLTSMQFFDALQGVVAQSSKGEQISFGGAQKLSQSGLMPAWINSLPYKSAILEMSNERFEALSAEERTNLEYEIEAKLQLYREINENADLWLALDQRDAEIDKVYPLSLSALP